MISPIKRALISVFDKTGVVELCQFLVANDIEILSTGGTAKLLAENNLPVKEVSDYTEFPEMMDGRVKTLHPKIHGGILARRGQDDDVLKENEILPIDLVVTNLYPFASVISEPNCDLAKAIENIDIGGPTMLRAAAKNYQHVAVVIDPADYQQVIQVLTENKGILSEPFCFSLAQKVFSHTAQYDGLIANYLSSQHGADANFFPQTLTLQFHKKQDMRYGENPHQNAAFYTEASTQNNTIQTGSMATAKQIQGKELSYNNVADTDAALQCVQQFLSDHCCVIVKHANPCGVAYAEHQMTAYQKAYQTDSESAFGGIIAFNTALQAETASQIIEQQFAEVIIAPIVDEDAKRQLAKKKNIRVLESGFVNEKQNTLNYLFNNFDYKRVIDGLLVQDNDTLLYQSLKVVTNRQPSEQQLDDLLFALKVCQYVKSNAIIYAVNQRTIGVGAGQMSRVNSARIAAIKAEHAGLTLQNAVMASDAFFPFRDAIEQAAKAGISAIIQPGGSIRDDEVIAAANEHDIAMVFTATRHFRH